MKKKVTKAFLILIFHQISSVYGACEPPEKPAPCFSQQEFSDYYQQAKFTYEVTVKHLKDAYSVDGFLLEKDNAVYHHFKQHDFNQFVIEQNDFTTIIINTLQMIKADKGYSKQQLRWCVQNITLPAELPRLKINCSPNNTNYYRLDGQCNSPTNPLFGALYTPFLRLLEDGYEDGLENVSDIKTFETARSDSNSANAVRGLNQNLSPETTSDMATMGFTILTHDLIKTNKAQLQSKGMGGGFDCCNTQKNPEVADLIKTNKYCLPISIPNKDPCYNSSVRCLNYVRSFRAFDNWDVTKAPAQVNFHTPYIDLDLIYNELSLEHLANNGGLFPLDDNDKLNNIIVGFDFRSMQLPGLFLYLHYFMQLHNEIVKEFKRVKPNNPIETSTFEARKITTAIFQKISLELISSTMEFKAPPSNCYNPNINPQVSQEFNHAFRVMHYFIRDRMGIYDANLFKTPSGLRRRLPSLIHQGDLIDNLTQYENNKCGLLHGLADTSWNLGGLGDITRCSFFAKPGQLGTDLRAMDFQFAREMGEPSYVSFLRFIGKLNKCDGDITAADIKSFDSGNLNFLLKRYKNKLPEIGLSIALDMEARHGAILEPGVESIIREQLNRTICGDRFWFNHDNGIFTSTQRNRLSNFDMNIVLCINHHCNDTRIQFFPFFSSGRSNRKVFCFSTLDILRILDLRTW